MDLILNDFPKTELEFDKLFGTEQACFDYLAGKKAEQGFVCSSCGHEKFWHSKRGLQICEKCEHQHSLTSGTIFHGSKKPLTMWFKVIWWYTTRKSGVNAKNLQELLGISYPTAWSWLQKLRSASVRPAREKLSGEVEVDEFYLGGKQEGKAGRGSENKIKVIVAVEKKGTQLGRIRMKQIPSCDAENLKAFIEDNIEKGTKVVTDGWKGYLPLSSNEDFDHQALVASISGEDVTPGVHRVASLFKRVAIGTYQGRISPKHAQKYLDEYVFRFNRRKSKSVGLKFMRMVELVALSSLMPFAKIVQQQLEYS
ncbi:MAG: IS1595 family transposase [Cyclobacteriaceae bacterium]